MASTVLGSLSDWNALEQAVDRWASFGALTLGVVGAVLLIVLL